MNIQDIIREYTENNKSINQLSKEFNTYPAKVFRILKKHGIQIRGKSEAQKNALNSGISKHPTMGKNRSESTKRKISEKNANVWRNKSDEDKAEFKNKAKINWHKKSADERIAMSKKAGAGLRKASIEGSKAEHFVQSKLEEAGYKVHIHRKDIGGQYEVDIYLPDYQIAIEIDGPQHFLPVFGEDRLAKNIKYDTVKNGILLSKGIKIIRVKYIKKHSSQKILNDLWDGINNALTLIKNNKNSKNLIEIEV